MPASDSDQEQGDYRLDGTLREQEEFMLKEVAAKFGITLEARALVACNRAQRLWPCDRTQWMQDAGWQK